MHVSPSRAWKSPRPDHDRPGVTLVELLVVITILGLLLALLLPAIQASREAARRTQCKNHLKQMALAALNHVQSQGHFPAGGWPGPWVGEAGRGFGKEQPGGWIYNILPYLEQHALHQLDANTTGQDRLDMLNQRDATPLEVFNCPARRASITYPNHNGPNFNGNRSPWHARSDYAACCGDSPGVELDLAWVMSFADFVDPSRHWAPYPAYTGISYCFSLVSMAQVIDGASNTYMLGERYIQPDHYLDGRSHSDDWSMYRSSQDDQIRSTYHSKFFSWTPLQDRPGLAIDTRFGSAHFDSCNFALCDGSVRAISYRIDGETNRRLGNRKDQLPIDDGSR